MADFERDTSVSPRGDGVFDFEIWPAWWVVAGPNGGYLAAILVRALSAGPEPDGRALRSLTVHYLRAPQAGPAEAHVETDRHGRSVSFRRARLVQEGHLCASALALFASDRPGLELERAHPPQVALPERIEPLPERPSLPPFAQRFDYRAAIGGPLFGEGEEALTGGWLRLRDERALDSAALVALCDSWYPAVFAVSSGPLAVPTLDLTVHLRAALPRPADWVLGRYATRVARDGFLEEDADLFSRDGILLAQSRQLALAG
jgi:acyl-CoA thioesterase